MQEINMNSTKTTKFYVKYVRYYIFRRVIALSDNSSLPMVLYYQAKVITLSGSKFITLSGDVIILSDSYYIIRCLHYIIRQLLH